jgi:hypothetical protein
VKLQNRSGFSYRDLAIGILAIGILAIGILAIGILAIDQGCGSLEVANSIYFSEIRILRTLSKSLTRDLLRISEVGVFPFNMIKSRRSSIGNVPER